MAEIVERPKSYSDIAKETAKRVFKHENAALIIVLGILIGAFSILTKGKSSTVTNLKHILIQSSVAGMASIGQTFVILTAGIDLTPTGLVLFSSCAGGWLMSRGIVGQAAQWTGPQLPIALGLLIVVLIGIGVGAASGSLVSRVGVPPLIVTLAMWQITRGLALRISKGFTITGFPKGLAFFGQGNIAGVPVPVIIFLVSIGVAYFILNHTTFGRSVYSVGGNRVSAWLSGINVKGRLLWVYTISGFTTALAAIIIMSRTMTASMFVIEGLELDSIAAVTVGGVSLMGGRGNIIGVLMGVLIIGVVTNAMSIMRLAHGMEDIVRGAIIITAVAIDVLRRGRG